MAFNNKNQNQRKKAPKYGNPDPMANVRDMGRYGIRVIRDIAKGKFNFYNEGHIFRNRTFTEATIKEAERILEEANIHVAAMQYTYARSDHPTVQKVMMDDMRKVEAYTQVIQVLRMIVDNPMDPEGNGDTRYLTILINKLPKYKYNM